ncbi:M24 family metallopeptidase [Roseitalea porphyridii]|uniref:Aminopeptidase P family protein n=1 Tax=Roseitalea porphyridii TaxID=1852022 RepID=A0A4P6UYJ9_9HYPH|nr:Xaa-Pro peptidase family protein [Roseitalea porphyridii]QBK30187.1 aminopeptidase P family protein [Roseitalea porphyridii]
MAERSLIFGADEYRGRIRRLQTEMAETGLAALLLTTPADVFYATGFLTRFWESPTRPWFVVVPEAGEPVAVIPAIGAELMARTWIGDIRTWNAPDPADDGVTLLVDVICSLSRSQARIGVPMGSETHLRMPMADFARVAERIVPRSFVDATAEVRRVREIKSEAEIDKLRTVCEIADRAFARVPEFAQAGRALESVFRDFQIALLEEGADWVGYLAGGAGRQGYADVISPASPEPLTTDDVLMLDTGAVRDGYFCDFDRNFAIGPVTDAIRKTQDALWLTTEAALETLRPGMRASDVHAFMTADLLRRGVQPARGRLGHGLGISLTEWPSFSPLDDTVLRQNMVLTLEPSAEVVPGRFLVHEEDIVLRANGPELLSARAPQILPRIGG